jgi:tRNA pseudouridine38-40 synthase
MKFKITLEYAGTNYSGWQVQKGARTIQSTVIDAIKKVLSETRGKSGFVEFTGSGRTDKGVHAIRQVAHLECETMLAPYILQFKINDLLPSDINILDIRKVKNNFNARYDAKSREYIYRISIRRTAFEKKYVWWVKDKLDIDKMISASKLFIGMHDFDSFCERDDENKSTKVLVNDINIKKENHIITLHFSASHFLWKMVRRLTGCIVEAGKGKINDNDITDFLNTESKIPALYTAPPSGLFLYKVNY